MMRILVVDDHALFRDGIVSLLSARGFEVVGQCENGEDAVNKATALQPDVILMDVKMPVMSGLEATRRLKASLAATKIVMLTVSEDDDDLFEAIKAGADGYLLKRLRAEDFFDLLSGLEKGEAALSRPLAARIMRELAKSREAKQEAAADGLTEREEEILKLLALGRSNRQISEELVISENTVKYHTKNILDKLHLQSRAEVVAYASRHARLS
jgi:DNA-binding NarL/FixJ family response regulator